MEEAVIEVGLTAEWEVEAAEEGALAVLVVGNEQRRWRSRGIWR